MLIKTSRRKFLTGLGASGLAMPFVRHLEGAARADESGPKRLLVFFSPNGTIPQHYWPSGTQHNFSFATGSILEPLRALKDKLIVIKGLEFYGATNHEGGMAAMLTNNGGTGTETDNWSLDQFIASYIGGETRFPSLELGVHTSVWGGSNQTRMSYMGPGSFVSPDDNPYNVYQRMFADQLVDANVAEKRRNRRKRILDMSRGHLSSLRERLGVEERVKLEAHTESLHQLENTIFSLPSCSPIALTQGLSTYSNADFPALTTAQIDLAVNALACDMTRVASIQLSHTVGPTAFSWLGIHEGHHGLSHGGDGTAQAHEYVLCERWYAEQFASLLQKLDARPDVEYGGSMLDNTLVIWANELGDGRLHTCTDVPFILAGGGAFQGGQFLDVGHAYHSKLLVSIARAFGININTFGNPGSGTGSLEALS
ncbi:MAG: DUF1552 domain-containing protein [Myxococcota bacterium]|nr:DUF1552 domain-containing protein [Myxococcota bacterium]